MSDIRERRARLRELIASGRTIAVPGATDALSARLIEKHGFDAVYIGSYATAASRYGLPDTGLLTLEDLAGAGALDRQRGEAAFDRGCRGRLQRSRQHVAHGGGLRAGGRLRDPHRGSHGHGQAHRPAAAPAPDRRGGGTHPRGGRCAHGAGFPHRGTHRRPLDRRGARRGAAASRGLRQGGRRPRLPHQCDPRAAHRDQAPRAKARS